MFFDFFVHHSFDIDLAEVLGADGFEFGLELLVGEGARVLEFAQTLIGEAVEVAVRDDRLQGFATVVRFAVFGKGEPAKEVFRSIVERVVDEMMTLAEIRFAFTVDESRAFAVEDLAHYDVASLIFELPHGGSDIPSSFLFSAHSRAIRVH